APRALVVTADAQSRLYGEANPPLTYTVGGLVGGDGLGGSLATAAGAASGVGRYAITVGSLAAPANYALTYQGADLTIAPRPVTLSGTRVYDATAAVAGGLLAAGNLVAGDAVAVSGIGRLAAKDVGAQALTGLSGLALSNPNYTLAGATGAVAITQATLLVGTLSARDRTY
ncbi:MBG domain-containing protein, partial [Methylobacterium oryzihabitans]|uniref:MBG domain-containing protein n=1 Tax=Methylobacterium oryzihabitans TaxID=2499852 RepID=UPI001651E9C9